MSNRKNIEKGRMEFAFEHSKNAKDKKKYEAYVLKVPAFIINNGLGNTIAYIAGQTNENWKKVGQNICQWLLMVDNPIKAKLEMEKGDKDITINHLLKVLKETSDKEYRSVTIEVLALFNWLRRFAKSHKQFNDG